MKGKSFLVLDIGTEVAKLLFFKKEGEKIIVLEETKQDIRKFGAWKTIQEGADIKTASSIISLPPDIFKARVVQLSFRRDKPKEIITKKEEKEIIQRILREAQEEITQDCAKRFGILPPEIQFIDSRILEMRIDGYGAPRLCRFRGSNLEFRVLASFLPQYYLQDFQRSFHDLNLKDFKIIHPVNGLIKVFKESDAVFLDIGGEITQIYLFKNNQLEKIDEFEFGGRDFTQVLSQRLGLPQDRARILKERYCRGQMSESVRRRIKEILDPLSQEWLSLLKSKLETFKILFPTTFFIFGGGSLLPEIEEMMQESDFKVEFLSPKSFKNIIDDANNLNSPQDINLILLCHTFDD